MSRLILSALLIALSPQAMADDVAEKLRICTAIEDGAARLACFDAIGRTAEPEPVESPVAPQPVEPSPVVPEPAPEPTPEAAGSVEPVPQTETPVSPVPAAVEAPVVETVEMGSETMEREKKREEKKKKKKEKKPREIVKASITRVREHQDGRWSVTLDNGQVWRETMGSRVGMPDDGASVELFKGRFGGYRMNIDGLYQTAWVKRTK